MEPSGYTVQIQVGGAINIAVLITYYLRAVERFRAHVDGQTGHRADIGGPTHAEGALAEALNWADTIDQYLRQGPRDTLGTDRDQNWAASVDGANGELVEAFQWVRNGVHHRWWNIVARESPTDRWLWGEAPTARRPGEGTRPDGLIAYENQMRGNDVLPTLDRLAEVFWARRRWEIHRADVEQPGYPVRSTLPFDPERDDTED